MFASDTINSTSGSSTIIQGSDTGECYGKEFTLSYISNDLHNNPQANVYSWLMSTLYQQCEGKFVCDIGCGAGRLRPVVSSAAAYVGLDSSAEMLKRIGSGSYFDWCSENEIESILFCSEEIKKLSNQSVCSIWLDLLIFSVVLITI